MLDPPPGPPVPQSVARQRGSATGTKFPHLQPPMPPGAGHYRLPERLTPPLPCLGKVTHGIAGGGGSSDSAFLGKAAHRWVSMGMEIEGVVGPPNPTTGKGAREWFRWADTKGTSHSHQSCHVPRPPSQGLPPGSLQRTKIIQFKCVHHMIFSV